MNSNDGAKFTFKPSPRSFNSKAPKCPFCEKSVYAAEQVLGPNGTPYHKMCLKCKRCLKVLDPMNLLEHGYDPYCKICHSKSFGTRGVGFGNAVVGDYVDDDKVRSPTRNDNDNLKSYRNPTSTTSCLNSPQSIVRSERKLEGSSENSPINYNMIRNSSDDQRYHSPPSNRKSYQNRFSQSSSSSSSPSPSSIGNSNLSSNRLRSDPRLESKTDDDDDDFEPPSLSNLRINVRARSSPTSNPSSTSETIDNERRTLEGYSSSSKDYSQRSFREGSVEIKRFTKDQEELHGEGNRSIPSIKKILNGSPPPSSSSSTTLERPVKNDYEPMIRGFERLERDGSDLNHNEEEKEEEEDLSKDHHSKDYNDDDGKFLNKKKELEGEESYSRSTIKINVINKNNGNGKMIIGIGKGLGNDGPKICPSCSSTVYHAEQVLALGKKWHKRCLRCQRCNKTLESNSMNESEGRAYCFKCYDDCFGTISQGFVLRAGFATR